MHQRPEPDIFEIVVVGGGLAGLVAAAALARAGRRVALLAPPRTRDGRTTALLGESVDFMAGLGVWDTVGPVSQAIRRIRLIDDQHHLVRAPEISFDADEVGLDAFGYNAPNEPLLAALDVAVANAGVLRVPGKAAGLVLKDDFAVVAMEDGTSVPAQLVVAADGRGSPTRSAAGIRFALDPMGEQTAVVTAFAHSAAHDETSTEFHTETGPFTLVPLSGARSSLVWVTSATEAERIAGLAEPALKAEIERRSHHLLGAVSDLDPVQSFRLARGEAERLASGRVALVGEAAHVLPPIAAQGFNLTIRDIQALCEVVGHAGDPGAAEGLSAYDRRRRADLKARSIAVGLLNRSLLTGSPALHALRSAGLHVLRHSAPLRRALIRSGLGLSVA